MLQHLTRSFEFLEGFGYFKNNKFKKYVILSNFLFSFRTGRLRFQILQTFFSYFPFNFVTFWYFEFTLCRNSYSKTKITLGSRFGIALIQIYHLILVIAWVQATFHRAQKTFSWSWFAFHEIWFLLYNFPTINNIERNIKINQIWK